MCWCKPRSRPAREKVQTCLNSSNLGKQSANVLELFFYLREIFVYVYLNLITSLLLPLKFSQNQKVNS